MNQQQLIKPEHLKDIDFRSRAERQKYAIDDFKQWYRHLSSLPTNDRIQGQLTMLSAVLWYILPEKDYRSLTKQK